MTGWVTVLVLLAGSGCLSALLARRPRLSAVAGAGGAMLACAAGVWLSVRGLLDGVSRAFQAAWLTSVGGAFHIGVDPLSAFFLTVLFLVGGLAALYGVRYLNAGHGGPRAAVSWLWYNLLVASMALTILARNALLFLAAWETMAIASFFLVTHEDERAETRQAGRIYLIAAHLGTLFIFVFMLALVRETGALDFDAWREAGARLDPAACAWLFVCLTLGFGTKAGFVPLHVWLPEAHPAAPSHVSAVMSGVMIKTGIYGILRFLPCLGSPPLWWGWAFVAIGLVSGVLGVLFALAQHDTKRLLAYSSVENMGVVALGMGTGLIGVAAHLPFVAAAGFAGAVLHVANHALFKGVLFLGAGAVWKAAGTREIDRLGGLLRRMPVTGVACLAGAAAICGLPPLNGFVGEFLIYWAAGTGVSAESGAVAVPLMMGIAGLALTGGLAAVCFVKLFGGVFLGEPRSPEAAAARESPAAMLAPMAVLAALCAGIGLAAPLVVRVLPPVLAGVTQLPESDLAMAMMAGADGIFAVSLMAFLVWILVAGVAVVRRLCLRRGQVRGAVTWDCGYARPSARMQYTASSFVQPLVGLFAGVLRSRRRFDMAPGLFPAAGSLDTETRDVFRERFFTPVFRGVDRWLSFLKWLQSGRIHVYVLYIVVTLLALLVWALRAQA
jgi:formate hydrogenlyase subunit 3/multisubunit Na+/H+ antiporter MnhD subunit